MVYLLRNRDWSSHIDSMSVVYGTDRKHSGGNYGVADCVGCIWTFIHDYGVEEASALDTDFASWKSLLDSDSHYLFGVGIQF